jgi:GNAT superfamily N-acetyltransferase
MPINKFVPTDFSVKKLDAKTDLSGFSCKENDDLGLDEFIHSEAFGYQRESMGTTYLFYNDDKIAGYITVAMGSIGVKMTKLRLDIYGDKIRYPALLLGRLAVQSGLRRRAVGRCMVLWCIGLVQKLSESLGCRFIVLVTKGESRINFYKECGFEESAIDQQKEMKMMYFQLF